MNKDKEFLKEKLKNIIKKNNRYNLPIKVACIGTDLSLYDTLGPLVGTMLLEKGVDEKFIEGTLDNPLHRPRLESEDYDLDSNKYFIIAVDACVLEENNMYYDFYDVKIDHSPIHPAGGIGVICKPIGNASIKVMVKEPSPISVLISDNRFRNIYSSAKLVVDVLYDFIK